MNKSFTNMYRMQKLSDKCIDHSLNHCNNLAVKHSVCETICWSVSCFTLLNRWQLKSHRSSNWKAHSQTNSQANNKKPRRHPSKEWDYNVAKIGAYTSTSATTRSQQEKRWAGGGNVHDRFLLCRWVVIV